MVAVHRRSGKNKEEKRRFARHSSTITLHRLVLEDLTVALRLPYAILPQSHHLNALIGQSNS